MENLSDLQLSEISRLLDERYFVLQLRMRRLKPLYAKKPTFFVDVKNEMELIDSINESLWKSK